MISSLKFQVHEPVVAKRPAVKAIMQHVCANPYMYMLLSLMNSGNASFQGYSEGGLLVSITCFLLLFLDFC